jgi:hypothetical protein
MAFTTQKPPDSAPPEGKSKDRFARNRPIDKAAAALAEKHMLPTPPGKTLKWDAMQEYLALLTEEMWQHVSLYLYRLKPRIIRQLKDPDAPKYIDCIGQPLTMEYMIERHGGGSYLIEAIDNDARKHSTSNHLFRCIFSVDEVRYEPKLNYDELDLTHRDNMSYVQMLQHRGVLDNKGHAVNNQAQQNSGNGGVNAEVIKEILGFVSKLNTDQQVALRSKLTTDEDSVSKSIGQIMVEKMKQDNPTAQVQMLSGLLTALKEIVGSSKPADASGLYDRIITMQSEHNRTVLQLIERITTKREDTENTDEFDRLDKVLGFAQRLSEMKGGGGRRSSPWELGLDYAKELLVPGLQTLNNFLATRRGVPVMPAGAGVAPVAPTAAFDPYRNPEALRAHASTLAAQQAAPPEATNGPAAPAGSLLGLVQQYGDLVVNALNNGTPGYDFADYVAGLLGHATHATIAGQGEDALLQVMLTMPQLSLFGEPRLRTFVHEFIHYEEFLKESEDEEEPEEPLAEPVTIARANAKPKAHRATS